MSTEQPLPPRRSRFRVIDISLSAISSLRPVVALIKRRDKHLADQVQRALTNVALNLGEGAYRQGGNQQLSFRRAAGEANEAMVALRVAVAWGYLTASQVAEGLDRLDHVLAIVAKLR